MKNIQENSKNLIEKLQKEITNLKDLLEIEKAVNLHKCPKIDLKEGDYFTITPKEGSFCFKIGDKSYLEDIFSFIKEDKIRPGRVGIIGIRMMRKFEENKIEFHQFDDPVSFLTTEYNFYKYHETIRY